MPMQLQSTLRANLIDDFENLLAATTESKNIIPDVDSTYDLGSSTKQWSNIHADLANIDAITGNLTGNVKAISFSSYNSS